MARYIDADKIDYTVTIVGEAENAGYRAVAFESDIDEMPTADVMEVKRGHWIEDEVCVYACSECGFTFRSAEDISEFKFCRCGAKMDGKE